MPEPITPGLATSRMTLGRLERVALRDVWADEAGDFTPWLASKENIAILGDAIGGVELEVEDQEKPVGQFRSDIVCKDIFTAKHVLIENQLGPTDHKHLGQVMTYAAGLQATTIVWIAAEIKDEHRAALDWLNQMAKGSFNFFGLEIELWRIGDSPVAPKFNVVCKPNEWNAAVASVEELTETKQLQLDYWTKFREYVKAQGGPIRCQKPFPQSWTNFAIGKFGFTMRASVNTSENKIAVALVLDGTLAAQRIDALKKSQAEIEKEFGQPLEWPSDPGRKQQVISIRRAEADLSAQADWPNQHKWVLDKILLFRKAFGLRIRDIDFQISEAMAIES